MRNFKIANYPSPSMFTGPRIDRTTKTEFGSYLYSRGSELEPGDVRIIQTPSIDMATPPTKTWCFSFWYLAFGGSSQDYG